MLFEQKKDRVRNKWRFVENRTQITWLVLKMRLIFLLPKYIKTDFEGCFFNKRLHVWSLIV
jgi:hypothetical protein